MYLYLLVILAGAALSGIAAARVRSTFAKYSKLPTRSQMTGAEVARAILRDHDIHDVKVEPVAGHLSDHYDPRDKTLRLSEPVYSQSNMAAFGVAAHEVGHAIQHATKYSGLEFRSGWVPLASIGSNLSFIVIIVAMLLGGFHVGGAGAVVAWLGLGLFACVTVFTLITIPVEFDASKRALATLERGGYTTAEELDGARKVLNAAAMTYVAAFATSLMQLLYWAAQLGLSGRDE